jgi:hypothetical protein
LIIISYTLAFIGEGRRMSKDKGRKEVKKPKKDKTK